MERRLQATAPNEGSPAAGGREALLERVVPGQGGPATSGRVPRKVRVGQPPTIEEPTAEATPNEGFPANSIKEAQIR